MDPYLAQVILFAGNFAPQGWAYCDGSLLPISQNSALYSLVGNMYGGNGTTTFALPDLRGRIAIGAGQGRGLSYHSVGEASGSEAHTLLASQMPTHTHTVTIPTSEAPASADEPAGNVLTAVSPARYAPATGAEGRYGGVQVSIAGASQPVTILQPYLALNYIIALEGIYPSRS